MLGSSQQCRLNAVYCLALAEQATETQSRQDLIVLADTWKRLAAERESDDALLQTMSEIELNEGLPLTLNSRSAA